MDQKEEAERIRKMNLKVGDRVIVKEYPYYIATVKPWFLDSERLIVNIPPDQRKPDKDGKEQTLWLELSIGFGCNVGCNDYHYLGKQKEKQIRWSWSKYPKIIEKNPRQLAHSVS
jgi:hypothetical protein